MPEIARQRSDAIFGGHGSFRIESVMTGPLVDELGEPYLPLKDGYTLTPIRLSDADQFVSAGR